ncbi:hypothetical protein Ancab_015248 [Ancistrocladus abbreviatus]
MWMELIGAAATNQLSGDVMIEILTRLPVKSLIRFKSVCKTWYILFNNPIFIKIHMNVTKDTASVTNSLSLVVHARDKTNSNQILSLVLKPPYLDPITAYLHPSFDGFDYINIVGSINGLICLNLCTVATSIVLWNPATRHHFQIQHPQLTLEDDERVSLGFAYCSKVDDYKVIRILYTKHFKADMCPSRVEIYSTQVNSWRSVEGVNLPWLCYQKTCGSIANGVPYWYAFDLQDEGPTFRELITWFDVSCEVFNIYPLPSYHQHSNSRFRMRLGVLEENPAVIVYNGGFEVWLLDQSGVEGNRVSWTKKFSVDSIMGVERVIGCWKHGEIIAEDANGGLVLFDPSPKSIKDIPTTGSWGFLEVYGYTESLVSPIRCA